MESWQKQNSILNLIKFSLIIGYICHDYILSITFFFFFFLYFIYIELLIFYIELTHLTQKLKNLYQMRHMAQNAIVFHLIT